MNLTPTFNIKIMIYIIRDYDSVVETMIIEAVVETSINIEKKYKEFILEKAKERGIVINNHWLNIMNYPDYHSHLSIKEYDKASRGWSIFLKRNTLLKFVKSELNLTTIDFKDVINNYE